MYKITETQFDELPKELQDLYEKLPNHSREEVLECFPESKSQGGFTKGHGGEKSSFGLAAPENVNRYAGETGSAARFFYSPKASKKDRDEGLEGFEEKTVNSALNTKNGAGERLDGAKSATRSNFHPTVKPTALMRYLVKLVTPPGGTVLDPFTGSGSTGKACKLEGFEFIGIEREEEYVKIAKARIEAVSYTPTLL